MVMYKNNTAAAMALRAARGRINKLITHTHTHSSPMPASSVCLDALRVHVDVAQQSWGMQFARGMHLGQWHTGKGQRGGKRKNIFRD